MCSTLKRLAIPAFVATLVSFAAEPAAAQSISGRFDAPDSVSWIVKRQPYSANAKALRTADRGAALVLIDSALAIQLTDSGLARTVRITDDTNDLGGRVLARMIRAGVAGLLDHGIAYRLTELRLARAEGSRLVLENHQGENVFGDAEVNGRRVMSSFVPAEAERFASEINRAIARAR